MILLTASMRCACYIKGVTAKMCLSLSISVHSLVLESPKPSVKAFKEEKDSNNMSLGDSSTKWWTEIERLSHIYTVTPFSRRCNMFQ